MSSNVLLTCFAVVEKDLGLGPTFVAAVLFAESIWKQVQLSKDQGSFRSEITYDRNNATLLLLLVVSNHSRSIYLDTISSATSPYVKLRGNDAYAGYKTLLHHIHNSNSDLHTTWRDYRCRIDSFFDL